MLQTKPDPRQQRCTLHPVNHHLIDPPHQADGDQADGDADSSTETEPDQLSSVGSKDWAGASREEILRNKAMAAEVKDYHRPALPRSGRSSPSSVVHEQARQKMAFKRQ